LDAVDHYYVDAETDADQAPYPNADTFYDALYVAFVNRLAVWHHDKRWWCSCDIGHSAEEPRCEACKTERPVPRSFAQRVMRRFSNLVLR